MGLVIVLDVRPPDEFALGHVPGAINVPLGELESHIQEIDPALEVVAYCRGPWYVMSFEAVAALRCLRGDWRTACRNGRRRGLPVELAA